MIRPKKDTYTVAEMAEEFPIGETTIRKLIKNKELLAYKVTNAKYIIDADSIVDFFERKKTFGKRKKYSPEPRRRKVNYKKVGKHEVVQLPN